MADTKARVKAMMERIRREQRLPRSEAIVEEAFERLQLVPGRLSPDEVLCNFNELLRSVWDEALRVLEEHEERSYAKGIPSLLATEVPGTVSDAEQVARRKGFAAGVLHLLASWYPLLRECFLSVAQSRKSRGGKDFELQIERLLELAQVPYEKQAGPLRTDLILPDNVTFKRDRTVCAVVSIKRTLRERWQQVVDELYELRAPNVFLLTADQNISKSKVARIADNNIHLVVWDEVKQARHRDIPLVVGYTEWAHSSLRRLRQQW